MTLSAFPPVTTPVMIWLLPESSDPAVAYDLLLRGFGVVEQVLMGVIP